MDGGSLVTGKVEVDEPLLVEALGGLLKELDLPAVILDKLVIGREHFSNTSLLLKVPFNFER